LFGKFFQPRVGEPARVELRGGFFRRERLGFKVRAASQQTGCQKSWPKFHKNVTTGLVY